MVAVDLRLSRARTRKVRSTQTSAELPPQGLKAMKVIEGGPTKIVLVVGDSTVAPRRWLDRPGFCAVLTKNVTCIDLALNGRSTKSFRDEGAWAKALAAKGRLLLHPVRP